MKYQSDQIELINKTFLRAKDLHVIQKSIEDASTNGRHVTVDGKKVAFWGNCSYLGLNNDPRLKAAAIDAIERYGLQFVTSRTFNQLPLYDELEDKLSAMFEKPALSVQTTTLGHMSAIPALVSANDAIIMDQKVHASVQNNVQIVRANGTTVEVVRHNRMDILENRIQKLQDKYEKVWYMADGVYSMHGDIAPMNELYDLLNRYENFWTYIDDSHGLSWMGKNGRGASLDRMSYMHEKMVFIATLDKGFGANGGVLVLPNQDLKDHVRNVGSTMIFSAPSTPASLAGAIASAEIHLSAEIDALQHELNALITHFFATAQRLHLPLFTEEKTPIFYICIGDVTATIELAALLLQSGFLVNPVSFPAVSAKDAGLRITLTRHMTVQDIDELLTTIAELMHDFKKQDKLMRCLA
jgi:7-keto-8-aminopelargonate synthetase-like enzyme